MWMAGPGWTETFAVRQLMSAAAVSGNTHPEGMGRLIYPQLTGSFKKGVSYSVGKHAMPPRTVCDDY